ncbi:MAG TPA: ECF-type sigma factor [Gemmatimonadales bacterium]
MADASPNNGNTEKMVAVLYDELLAIAHRLRRAERDDHTLETSALVHEAFLLLATRHANAWQSREYFLAAAATTMRRVLVSYARARNADKRDARLRTTLVSVPDAFRSGDALDVLVLDDLLDRLTLLDARGAQVLELRVFGGFAVDEIAEILDVSPRTVKRDWRFARAWLVDQLTTVSHE